MNHCNYITLNDSLSPSNFHFLITNLSMSNNPRSPLRNVIHSHALCTQNTRHSAPRSPGGCHKNCNASNEESRNGKQVHAKHSTKPSWWSSKLPASSSMSTTGASKWQLPATSFKLATARGTEQSHLALSLDTSFTLLPHKAPGGHFFPHTTAMSLLAPWNTWGHSRCTSWKPLL